MPESRSAVPMQEGRARAARWGGSFVAGLLIFALGVLCLVAAGVAGFASILLFGALLLVAGVLEIFSAVRERKHGRQSLSHFLVGLLSIVVGGLFLLRPAVGLAALTLLLAGYFFADGLFRSVTSLLDRYEGWGWDFFSGAVSVVLGVIVFSQWPISALWVVGVLVAVQLMMRGLLVMSVSMALRRELRTVAA
jgi:uncharacterized membrane protein HdeD (DUF308 family)